METKIIQFDPQKRKNKGSDSAAQENKDIRPEENPGQVTRLREKSRFRMIGGKIASLSRRYVLLMDMDKRKNKHKMLEVAAELNSELIRTREEIIGAWNEVREEKTDLEKELGLTGKSDLAGQREIREKIRKKDREMEDLELMTESIKDMSEEMSYLET